MNEEDCKVFLQKIAEAKKAIQERNISAAKGILFEIKQIILKWRAAAYKKKENELIEILRNPIFDVYLVFFNKEIAQFTPI